MASDQASKYCKVCKCYRLHTRNRPSEFIGLVLTVLSVGLYFPLWVLTCLWYQVVTGYNCSVCGKYNRF